MRASVPTQACHHPQQFTVMQTTLDNAAPLVSDLAALLTEKSWVITTAESCTGGLVAAALTAMPGSSEWFHQSVVSYSNNAKTHLLGVEANLLTQHGAVSQQVVEAMAGGALLLGADVAVSISGIAGPGGGTVDKPVGTVWIGWALGAANPDSSSYHFEGDRSAVRAQALMEALRGTILRIQSAR